jgi:hypothetical protein
MLWLSNPWCPKRVYPSRASQYQCFCGKQRAEIKAAFCNAYRVTFVESTTPAFTRSTYSPVATSQPSFPEPDFTSCTINAPSVRHSRRVDARGIQQHGERSQGRFSRHLLVSNCSAPSARGSGQRHRQGRCLLRPQHALRATRLQPEPFLFHLGSRLQRRRSKDIQGRVSQRGFVCRWKTCRPASRDKDGWEHAVHASSQKGIGISRKRGQSVTIILTLGTEHILLGLLREG